MANCYSRTGFAVLLLVSLLSQISCGQTQADRPINSQTLMAAMRAYGSVTRPTAASAEDAFSTRSPLESESAYRLRIGSLFEKEDFEQLDKEAHEVRVNKTRVVGGAWKIYIFYGALLSTTDDSAYIDYNAKISEIKKWIALRPESATAQIALANTYLEFAWAARGSGYAKSVTDSAWSLFYQRIELSKTPLLEASHLKERCPFWYSLAMQVALDEGWDKSSAREVLDQATSFEPTYYHIYRQYANYLLPKWYGEEGETQAFAEETSARLGDPNGSIIYYEIASLLACQCDGSSDALRGMSWPKIKSGYAELKRLYGISNVKANRFAYMSVLASDKTSAQDAFATVGPDWNADVWYSGDKFESAKAWAYGP